MDGIHSSIRCAVARPEEALGAAEKALAVIMPADAGAGAEGFGDLRFIEPDGLHDFEGAAEKGRTVLIGKGHGLFGGQAESAVFVIIIDIFGRGLSGEPFAQVAFLVAGLTRQAFGRDGHAIGHGLVDAELVAQQDSGAGDGGAQLADHPADQCIEFLGIGLTHDCAPCEWTTSSMRRKGVRNFCRSVRLSETRGKPAGAGPPSGRKRRLGAVV